MLPMALGNADVGGKPAALSRDSVLKMEVVWGGLGARPRQFGRPSLAKPWRRRISTGSGCETATFSTANAGASRFREGKKLGKFSTISLRAADLDNFVRTNVATPRRRTPNPVHNMPRVAVVREPLFFYSQGVVFEQPLF